MHWFRWVLKIYFSENIHKWCYLAILCENDKSLTEQIPVKEEKRNKSLPEILELFEESVCGN